LKEKGVSNIVGSGNWFDLARKAIGNDIYCSIVGETPALEVKQ